MAGSSKQLRAFFAKLRAGDLISPSGRVAVTLPVHKTSSLNTKGSKVRKLVARSIKKARGNQKSGGTSSGFARSKSGRTSALLTRDFKIPISRSAVKIK